MSFIWCAVVECCLNSRVFSCHCISKTGFRQYRCTVQMPRPHCSPYSREIIRHARHSISPTHPQIAGRQGAPSQLYQSTQVTSQRIEGLDSNWQVLLRSSTIPSRPRSAWALHACPLEHQSDRGCPGATDQRHEELVPEELLASFLKDILRHRSCIDNSRLFSQLPNGPPFIHSRPCRPLLWLHTAAPLDKMRNDIDSLLIPSQDPRPHFILLKYGDLALEAGRHRSDDGCQHA